MYNSFPYNNFGMPVQQRLNTMDNSYIGIKGRVVSNQEEVRAAQIDFDGSTYYFVCPGENKIYTKTIGLNGMPMYGTFVPAAEPVNEFQALTERVEDLEKLLKGANNESITNVAE